MRKVVLTGLPGVTQDVIEKFKENLKNEYANAEVVYIAEDEIPDDEFIAKCGDAEIVLSWVQQMTAKTYEQLNLKAFCAPSIGFNAANIEEATKHEVLVTNCGDYCAEEVAVHTVMLMLNMARKAYAFVEDVKNGNWRLSPAGDLKRFSESTVGLVGFGNIPKRVAEMLSGFGAKVLSYDPFVEENTMKGYNVAKVDLDTLIRESDYISLHTPLLPATEKMICKESIDKMKDHVFIVNTARGGLVNYEHLYQALVSGKVQAAGLDVLENEPLQEIDYKIIGLKNTIVTPHSAFISNESEDSLWEISAKAVGDILNGRLPENVKNQQVVEKLRWIK